MEVTQVEMTETVDNLASVKRRKLSGSLPFVQIKTIDCEIYVNSVPRSSGVLESHCSSIGSLENLKLLDLEEGVETGSLVIGRYDSNGDESIRESKLKEESGELGSTASEVVKSPSPCPMLSMEKIPPESELDEFFAAAQEGLNKRFKDKYNFDVVGDIPLEGRFEWIQVMPGK